MKKWIFGIVIGVMLIVTPIGCDEEQLRTVDRVVSDVNSVSTGARAVLETPAGQAVPADIRLMIELALGLVSAGTIGWQKWRSGIMTKTTKAIVRGVEQTAPAGNPDPDVRTNNLVKMNIQQQMIKAGVFDQGNRIVDRLKGVS